MLRSVIAYVSGSVQLLETRAPDQPAAPTSLFTFAQAVTNKLEVDLGSLPSGPHISLVKGILTSYLPSIQELFSGCCLDGAGDSRNQTRTLAILDNLEKLCQWPSYHERTGVRDNTFDLKRYPGLSSFLGTDNSVQGAVKEFAHARATRNLAACTLWKQLINSFEGFSEPESEPRGPELSELQELEVTKEDFEDNQTFVLNLHKALSEHFLFHCHYEWGSVTTNLRLNWWCREQGESADALSFSVFFLGGHTSKQWDTASQWQDTQISVFRSTQVIIQEPLEVNAVQDKQDERELQEKGSDVNETCDASSSSSGEDEVDEFCQLIGASTQSQLRFVYSTNFEYQGPCQPARLFLRSSPSISLAKVIGSGKLTDKMKLLLSYLLVRTLWQYYKSGWMAEDWSKESVHFMFDDYDGVSKVISVNEPFLQTRFNTADNSGRGEDASGPAKVQGDKKHYKQLSKLKAKVRTHPYPKVLALGVMLLEIELDKKIEDFNGPDCHDPDEINVLHNIAVKVLKNKTIWPPKGIYWAVQQAIEICIKPDLDVLGSNEKRLRANCFHWVVGPFKALMAILWPNADTQEMNPIAFELTQPQSSCTGDEVSTTNTTGYTGLSSGPSVPSLDDGVMNAEFCSILKIGSTMASDSPFTADEWFSKLDDLNYVLKIRKNKRDKEAEPIKVAILDTGVLESYYQVDQSTQKSIMGYKDFVSKDDTKRQDNTLHGTSCLQLLQKICEDAEIYIGRVFQGGQATDATHLLMAEAIKYAVTEWNVKVICIPSGFTTPSSAVNDAISDALHAKTLIFAAASNLSNFTSIAFPGRLFQTFRLLCMFSTTAGVKPTCYFNPAALKDARFNFAILGEGITVPPVQRGAIQKQLYGTSFSTIIAAGVAAQIVDFSRHPDVRGKIDDVESLCQVEGMSAVFAQMVSAVDNRYHCLTPWRLLGGLTTENTPEEDIRADICKKISIALTTRYDIRV